jgi:hypothetical protein
MRGAAVAFLVLLASGCAAPQKGAASTAVHVTRVELRLDGPDDGALSVQLMLERPHGPFREVEWELELDGLRVAAGLERVPRESSTSPDGRVTLAFDSPLVFRSVPWRAGSAFVQVEVRGVVRLQPPAREALPFSARKEVLVRGTPEIERRRH